MIVVCPELLHGSQVVAVGRDPSRLCQREGIDIADAVGIVFGGLIVGLFRQSDGALCSGQ